jgi:Fe-S cluster assembly iron-binding protein IscA
MLEITDIAAEKLAAHMKKNGQGKAVRITLRKGG